MASHAGFVWHRGKRQLEKGLLSYLWIMLFPFLGASYIIFFVYVFQGENYQTGGLDDFVSCSKSGEIITKASVREIGKPPTKKGAYLVIALLVQLKVLP